MTQGYGFGQNHHWVISNHREDSTLVTQLGWAGYILSLRKRLGFLSVFMDSVITAAHRTGPTIIYFLVSFSFPLPSPLSSSLFFFVVLWMEHRALCTLAKSSTSSYTPNSVFLDPITIDPAFLLPVGTSQRTLLALYCVSIDG